MNLFDHLEEWFYNAYEFFRSIAWECWNSFYLPDTLGDLFLSIANAFLWSSTYFWQASNWYNDVEWRMEQILDWVTIWDYIKQYAQPLFNIIRSLSTWVSSIINEVNTWWLATQVIVKGWIQAATQGLSTLQQAWSDFWNITFPSWTKQVTTLAADLGNFFTETLPQLPLWADIESWFSSRITELEPLWSGWQEQKENVTGFFQNPLDFLWDKFADWFLGVEEKH